MAKNPLSGKVSQRIETHFMDEQGNEIPDATLVYTEEMVTDPVTQASTITKRAENTILVSGEAYNPSMSGGAKPVMMVARCSLCARERSILPWRRRPQTHGMLNVKHLRHCVCGAPVCRRHGSVSRYDKQVRCPGCHRKHKWMLFFKGLFFERIES